MQTVRVNRDELRTRVQHNRDAHHELFVKAQAGFRARAVEEIDAMLKAAANGGPVRLHVGLQAPSDHTAEYDRALAMLAMSTDETIAIDATTFAQLVMNEWTWFERVTATNSLYASGGKLDEPGY